MKNRLFLRWVLGCVAVAGLALVFVFQDTNIAMRLGFNVEEGTQFLINKAVRFILNDLLTILLIFALFNDRRYVLFAVWVQLVGMCLFLIPYLVIKSYLPTYNGPLINYIHRLVLNPILLLLLIPAFYFQRFADRNNRQL